MAQNTELLSRLMKISWDIQKRKCSTRSKSLQQAWAIVANEDITVSYLVRKLNHHRPVNWKIESQFTLFSK